VALAQEVEGILINDLPARPSTAPRLWNPRGQLKPRPVLIDDRREWNRAVHSNLPKFQPVVLRAGREERHEPEVHLLPPAERPFEVVQHQSRVVKADQPIVEFVIANPDTADVKQLRPDELVLIGRGPGVTTLTLWLEGAKLPRQFTIMCQPSEPRREREQRPESARGPEPAREHIEHLERQLREAHEALQHTNARINELQERMQRQTQERERSLERERVNHEREMDRRPEPRRPEPSRRRTDD